MRNQKLFDSAAKLAFTIRIGLGTVGLCLLGSGTLTFASVPLPAVTPPPEFQGSFEGLDLTRQWYDMLFWTRDRAKLVIDDVKALARPNPKSLPTNIWGKSVVISFTDLGFQGNPATMFGFYERENCTGRGIARAGLGARACSWNLRVIEIADQTWFTNGGDYTNNKSAAWVSANLKPAALAAQFRAVRPEARASFVPNWAAFGDPKSAVTADTFTITVFRGVNCPQVITGLVRLNAITRARDPSTLLDGPYPPMPPAGIVPRQATLYLGASGTGNDLSPENTETLAGFVNQVGEEVKRVRANCDNYGGTREFVEFPSWPPSLPR
jgi:hypothetical protein